MGHKTLARDLIDAHGMPMGVSSGLFNTDDALTLTEAARVYSVFVKPAGGDGNGMSAVGDDAQLLQAVERTRSLAQRSLDSAELYLERLVERPRHVEFQILADRHENIRQLFERDCSIQRRHQKVIEEAGAPAIARAEVAAAAETITRILDQLGFDVIGTVETLNDGAGNFNFLEMNTRRAKAAKQAAATTNTETSTIT